jgi:hypothetical protein
MEEVNFFVLSFFLFCHLYLVSAELKDKLVDLGLGRRHVGHVHPVVAAVVAVPKLAPMHPERHCKLHRVDQSIVRHFQSRLAEKEEEEEKEIMRFKSSKIGVAFFFSSFFLGPRIGRWNRCQHRAGTLPPRRGMSSSRPW